VDVEQGAAITAAQVGLVIDPMIADILSRGIRKASFKGSVSEATETRKEGEEIPLDISSNSINDWKITLKSYQWSENGDIRFNLVIENLYNRPRNFQFKLDDSYTYLLDNFAHKYFKPTGNISKNELQIIQEVQLEKFLKFEKINPEAEMIFLFIRCRIEKTNGYSETVDFKIGPIKIK